jgi:quercetin dioxygenase-like cupin family protein
MRILTTKDAVEAQPNPAQGVARALHLLDEDDLTCALRTIAAGTNSLTAPRNKGTHRHLVYVVKGAATISNSEYYEKITAGQFVLFEPGEAPQYQTGGEELTVLEISWTDASAVAPRDAKAVGAVPEQRVAPETHQARGGQYMEI